MQSRFFRWFAGRSCLSVAAVAPIAVVQIKVGVTISTTGGSATPAVPPRKTLAERDHQGRIYQRHGVGTLESLKVGGKVVEGAFFPTGPAIVTKQPPADHPLKKVAMDGWTDGPRRRYQAAYGEGTVTQFAADAQAPGC